MHSVHTRKLVLHHPYAASLLLCHIAAPLPPSKKKYICLTLNSVVSCSVYLWSYKCLISWKLRWRIECLDWHLWVSVSLWGLQLLYQVRKGSSLCYNHDDDVKTRVSQSTKNCNCIITCIMHSACLSEIWQSQCTWTYDLTNMVSCDMLADCYTSMLHMYGKSFC